MSNDAVGMCDIPAQNFRAATRRIRCLLAGVCLLSAAGCGGKGEATPSDGSADVGDGAVGERPVVLCAEVDAGPSTGSDATGAEQADGGADGGLPTEDEFGPNAPAAKASSLGRVNVYEVATAALLERVDVYLRADLDATRLTIAVQEAPSRTAPFRNLAHVQLGFDTCQGWASSGPLAIPLVVGRYYAIGFDPNQVVTAFVSTDAESVPIDGAFGRLIGSRTATSVSTPNLSWDKLTEKEYNRQRLLTSPRAPDPVPDGGTEPTVPTDGGTDTRG
jgi:hypothetical protein